VEAWGLEGFSLAGGSAVVWKPGALYNNSIFDTSKKTGLKVPCNALLRSVKH